MFTHIGHKIIMVIATVVTGVMLILMYYYTLNQEQSILAQNERNMEKLTRSVSEGLQTIMISGYADVAGTFASRLQKVPDVTAFHILRTNGLEAFRDNKTIDEVNTRRGDEEFLPRDNEIEHRLLQSDNPDLLKALASKRMVSFYNTSKIGESFLTFLAPILNDKPCHKCHGSANPIRGLLLLTSSLAPVQQDVAATRRHAIQISVIALCVIIIITGLMIRLSVVRPISNVTEAMAEAADGNLDNKVPVLGRDELSRMAGSFNTMTSKLAETYTWLASEQDKLTTIIHSTREGIVVTDRKGHIVLINPAAEVLLGKSTDRLKQEGFLRLLDNEELIERHIERDHSEPCPEIVQYNSRILSFSASKITSKTGKLIGLGALFRDITEEKRLEQKLKELSVTDGLTGLFNRRYLDETLTTELEKASRYALDLSILMFDVDHFKRFNDDHGHDQGDRVLQALSQLMRETVRKVDVPCRYGGEEFLIILPNTCIKDATTLGERLREKVENTLVDGLSVTISIGVANYPTTAADTIDRLIEAADKALYAAKQAGRNRVCLASTDQDTVAFQI